MGRTGRVTLNVKEAKKNAAFLIALILPAGLHAAASVHLLTCCYSECLPDRPHGVGGEDKVTMNIRSFNSWPGALRALAAKQFKLSPKHVWQLGDPLTFSEGLPPGVNLHFTPRFRNWWEYLRHASEGCSISQKQIPVRVGVEELRSHWHWSEAACVGMSKGSRPGPSILATPENSGQLGLLCRGIVCALRITNSVPQKAARSLTAVDGRSVRNRGTSLVFTIHYKHFRYFFQIYIFGQRI